MFIDLNELAVARAEFLRTPVSLPETLLENPKAIDAITRGVETGKPFGLASFGASDTKQQIASVRVEGRVPASQSDWAVVQRWCLLHKQALVFTTRWNELQEVLSLPKLNGGVRGLRHMEIVVNAAKTAHELATKLDPRFEQLLRDVFSTNLKFPNGYSRGALESIRQHLQQNLSTIELAKATNRVGDLREKLSDKSGPVSRNLKSFLEETLGNAAITSEQARSRYSELLVEVRRVSGLGDKLAIVGDAARRIEAAGAHAFALGIRSSPLGPAGDDTAFPTSWKDAWTWSRVRNHLQAIEARSELITLSERRLRVEEGLARFYREMVSKAAWLSAKASATPKVLQALSGYATAIRKIGMGTGPNAIRYRRDAREQMFDAAGAVPCWIMNHNRISESMPAEIGSFDLIIVDEASQSDIWALPAILRGKKILVVGDDKQVSPDAGFIQSTRIQELLDRFLFQQPYKSEMTPEKSLYDLAARVFAADQIMLREHFRCVLPIITYSNRMFYQNQIVPLRLARASERIEPPLVDIHVTDGVRDSHDRNDPEAHAIAEEIAAILRDERFSKRSIGVVSLLGTEQAKHIDTVVREKCDAAELHRRSFLCGAPRNFQGSERDIMFLSMVVDRSNCKALSGNLFDQRFNVAASRARDRMYLVRSVLASELSDRDLRSSLLAHFDKPLVVDAPEAERLADLCESKFEEDVFEELTRRGYRVIPQVKAGAYRIDMVVEGAADIRLAIECDGDEYHGPDRWQHDMSRQRVLERAGWHFWRCFASTWTLRRDEVVFELLQKLHAMGIEPLGAAQTGGRLVEKRTWHRARESESKSDIADASSAWQN